MDINIQGLAISLVRETILRQKQLQQLYINIKSLAINLVNVTPKHQHPVSINQCYNVTPKYQHPVSGNHS